MPSTPGRWMDACERWRILPFSEVDCDGLRVFLQRGLLGLRAQDRALAYGRAVGRVLAHELYHIFADTKHHGSCGIAKEAFSSQDLLSEASISRIASPSR